MTNQTETDAANGHSDPRFSHLGAGPRPTATGHLVGLPSVTSVTEPPTALGPAQTEAETATGHPGTETDSDRSRSRSRRPVAGTAVRAVTAQATGRTNLLFYAAVLSVALVGSAFAARDWLGWVLPAAFAAVAVYELGAVAVSRFADYRRQLGERALAAQLLSAALAAGAVTLQILGHKDLKQALFFGGASATGYCIYLLESAAKRRDALRKEGKLSATPPAYGLLWIRHPGVTRRARDLFQANAEQALSNPSLTPLTRTTSLREAREEIRAERRLAAITDALRTNIKDVAGDRMATIAVNTYDLSKVATGLADAADYDTMIEILARKLTPQRLEQTGRKTDAGKATKTGTARKTETAGPVTPGIGLRTPVETEPVTPTTQTETDNRGLRSVSVVAAATGQTDVTSDVAPAGTGPEDDQTETATGPLADINPKLTGHIRTVMIRRTDWHVAVQMPPRHPDALSTSKIQTLTHVGGKPVLLGIKNALIQLAADPVAAEQALGVTGRQAI